jgi:hypothetical protein
VRSYADEGGAAPGPAPAAGTFEPATPKEGRGLPADSGPSVKVFSREKKRE